MVLTRDIFYYVCFLLMSELGGGEYPCFYFKKLYFKPRNCRPDYIYKKSLETLIYRREISKYLHSHPLWVSSNLSEVLGVRLML